MKRMLLHGSATVNRLVTFIISFNLFVSLYEAHFWHFTDPYQLGFIVWPFITLITAILVPGCILVVPQVSDLVLPMHVQHLLPFILDILMLISSLPDLDEQASTRTLLLAIGVFLVPFVVYWCWPPLEECARGFTGEFFIAVFCSMCVRVSSRSVNTFYETWTCPLAFMLLRLLMYWLHVYAHPKFAAGVYDDEVSDTVLTEAGSVGQLTEKADATAGGVEAAEKSDEIPSTATSIAVLILLVPGLTSSLMLFVQYFTSPRMFVRWSGLSSGWLEIVILLCSFLNAVVSAKLLDQTPYFRKPSKSVGEKTWFEVRVAYSGPRNIFERSE